MNPAHKPPRRVDTTRRFLLFIPVETRRSRRILVVGYYLFFVVFAVIHNYALLAIMLQLCLLYFTSGLFKAQGHVWQDGTAIYYILRNTEFNVSPLGPLLWRSAAVVTLLTWSTVVFEISWPFLIWFRKTRLWAVCGAVLLHAMIAYFMGLVWFSLVMISAQAVAVDDSEYRRAVRLVRRVLALGRARLAPAAVASGR